MTAQEILFHKPENKSFEDLFNEYLSNNEIPRDKISNFLQKVDNQYVVQEAEYIKRALIIATVAHQFNEDVCARTRKEIDPETGQNKPYIYHPLEMAERLVEDNLAWTMVASALVHDLPEDAKLGKDLSTPEQWKQVLRDVFKDTGKGGLIIDLIDGITEKSFDNLDQVEFDIIAQMQITKMIIDYVKKGKENKNLINEELEIIYKVAHNLNRLFKIALQSPDHLQLLVLKITDIWHNFQSPEWVKSEKVLRARIASNLSDWFGWHSMRTELVYLMAGIIDTASPYAPDKDKSFITEEVPVKEEEEQILANYAGIVPKALEGLKNLFGLTYDLNRQIHAGRAVAHTGHYPNRFGNTPFSAVEVAASLPREDIEEVINKQKKTNTINQPGFKITLKPLSLATGCIANFIGRARIDYNAKSGNSSFIFRIESDEPYIMDALENGSTIDLASVPEARGLFHGVCLNTNLQRTHIASLIGFLYEPNLAVLRASQVFALIYQGRIYFVDGEEKLNTILTELGIEISDISTIRTILKLPAKFESNLGKRKVKNLIPKAKSRKQMVLRTIILE